MRKFQTATEYLIILAVVIIIGVIVIVALGGIPGMGGGTGERAQLTGMRLADVGVDTFAVNCSHAVVVLKNNNPTSVRVEDFIVDDIICNSVRTGGDLPVVLSPGDSRTLTCTYESDSCLFRDYTSVRGVPRIGVKYSDISSGFTYTTPFYEESGSVLGLYFNVHPSTIYYNGSTTLTWDSTGAESCSASGDWSDSIGTSGSLVKSNVIENQSYTITCSFADSDDVSITRDLTVLDPGSPDPILGCTDPSANNYDSSATVDDGSCEYDPDPIDGLCGSAAGQSFSSAPTTNLCASGNPTTLSGTGPWSWVCQGLNGGADSNTCTANVISSSFSCNQQNAQGFYNGSGTPSEPFGICNITMLQNMNNYLSNHFVLLQDIDATGFNFEPIWDCGSQNCWQSAENPFTGSLNGLGYTITGLEISGSGTQGFIRVGSGTTLSNINFEEISISGDTAIGVIGYATSANISSVHIRGTIVGQDALGAFVGWGSSINIYDSSFTGSVSGVLAGGVSGIISSGTLSNVNVSGIISSGYIVGGFVGEARQLNISYSHFTGIISHSSPDEFTGGLIGSGFGVNIFRSSVLANITGGAFVGGLAGITESIIITESFFSGTISADYRSGGIVGELFGTISDSYAVVSFLQDGWAIGGLVGQVGGSQGSISNSYAVGSVSGDYEIGGLFGTTGTSFGPSVSNSFALVSVDSSVEESGGLIGIAGSLSIISGNYWDIGISGKSYCYLNAHTYQNESTGCTATNNQESLYYGSSGIPFVNLGWNPSIWSSQEGDLPKLAWQD